MTRVVRLRRYASSCAATDRRSRVMINRLVSDGAIPVIGFHDVSWCIPTGRSLRSARPVICCSAPRRSVSDTRAVRHVRR